MKQQELSNIFDRILEGANVEGWVGMRSDDTGMNLGIDWLRRLAPHEDWARQSPNCLWVQLPNSDS